MNSLLVIAIVLAILIIIGVSIWYAKKDIEEVPDEPTIPQPRGIRSQLELDILFEINEQRSKQELPLLKFNDIASVECQSHVEMCMRVGKVSHTDFGIRFANIKKTLPAARIGEVVAYGYRDAKSVVNGFLLSPEHKKIILGDYNQLGISAQTDSKGKMYVGAILIKIK